MILYLQIRSAFGGFVANAIEEVDNVLQKHHGEFYEGIGVSSHGVGFKLTTSFNKFEELSPTVVFSTTVSRHRIWQVRHNKYAVNFIVEDIEKALLIKWRPNISPREIMEAIHSWRST